MEGRPTPGEIPRRRFLPSDFVVYEHQNPVEFGLTRAQVDELGFFVVPQALHFQ
jgi:hypothetical protein